MKLIYILCAEIIILGILLSPRPKETPTRIHASHWFVLHRASNMEYLYSGMPGKIAQSQLLRTFSVKTGIPNQRPTPLPRLVGREYWIITNKKESKYNSETAPYFLTLNIPGSESEPYGPTPYTECNGQCNWILPGEFGLHGVNGDMTRLAQTNKGSSGCIRHSDADIIYLYHLLEPATEEIRYYIQDI